MIAGTWQTSARRFPSTLAFTVVSARVDVLPCPSARSLFYCKVLRRSLSAEPGGRPASRAPPCSRPLLTPLVLCLRPGESPDTAHNLYPELWARLNAEVFQEYVAERREGRCAEPAPLRLPAQPSQAPAGAGGAALLEEQVLQAVAEELAASDGAQPVREGDLLLADCLDQVLPAARSANNLEALVLPDPADGEAEAAGNKPPAGAGQEAAQDSRATAAEMSRIKDDAHGRGQEDKSTGPFAAGAADDDGVFFMRAGFRGSPRLARLFWLGDQVTSRAGARYGGTICS